MHSHNEAPYYLWLQKELLFLSGPCDSTHYTSCQISPQIIISKTITVVILLWVINASKYKQGCFQLLRMTHRIQHEPVCGLKYCINGIYTDLLLILTLSCCFTLPHYTIIIMWLPPLAGPTLPMLL